MKKVFAVSIILVCAAILITGCTKGFNVLGWTAPTGGSAQASAANGDSAFAAGNYAAAMASYDAAVTADPTNSKARYGYVKAYIKDAGVDIADFLKNYSGSSAPAFAVPGVAEKVCSKVPYNLIDDTTNPFGINVLKFEGLITVLIKYLDPIALGQCDSYIPATDVGLNINLAFAHLLKGIFIVIDPTWDGTIDYNFVHKDDGSVDIITVPGGVIVTQIAASVKAAALAELDTSIARLDVAIANSADKTAKLWSDVRDVLTNVKTEINSQTGTGN